MVLAVLLNMELKPPRLQSKGQSKEACTTGKTGIGYPVSQNEFASARIAFRQVVGTAESGEMSIGTRTG